MLKLIINKIYYYSKYHIFLLIIVILYILYTTRFLIIENINPQSQYDIQSEFLKNNKYKFPFRYLKNENNEIINIVALTAFFRSDNDKTMYMKYRELNIPVIGITAYKTFPLKIRDDSEDKYHLNDEFDYISNINNWLICMSDQSYYGFTEKNNILNLSESDFYNSDSIINVEKKYDYIYICNKDSDTCPLNGWNAINRNYNLALRCLPILAYEYKLKGLWIGRIGCDLTLYKDYVEVTDFLPYFELQQKMKESRFLFLPNIYDASPRVITECLTKNVPVLMNKNIICGFKYINDNTGEFFIDEHNIRNGLDKILYKLNNNLYNIQEWWNNNYGYIKSSKILRDFLYIHYPDIIGNSQYISLLI